MKLPVSFSVALAAFLTAVASVEAQSPPTKQKELTPTEKWIVEQVSAGEIANLWERFPNEPDRKLSAQFLQDLLTGALPDVTPRRNGVRIIGAIIDDPIELNHAKISFEVWLGDCQFKSDTSFMGASFAGNVLFNASTFRGEANFSSMKVGDTAFFNNAVFEGPVNFLSASTVDNFEAVEAQFKDAKQGACFNGIKVGGAAFFRQAVFEGTANFILADIGSNLEAQGVQFGNKDQGVFFYGMKVGQIASFEGAVFEGRAEFDAVEIAANFEMSGARFWGKSETVRMVMKCGKQGVFKDVVFAGPVTFEDSSFLDLVIGDMTPGAVSVPRLDLSRSSIKRHLRIRNISILDFAASWVHVEGPTDFTGLTVEHAADLSYGDFSTLDLSRSVWPKDAASFHMQGVNYKYIRAAAEEPESHAALLKLADQSTYNADVYRNLELFFSRQGYGADADAVFIAGKKRERKEYLRGPAWLGSWLLDKLVGYGRHPWRAGVPCAFFVILGCVIFLPQKMELRDTKELEKRPIQRRVYNRFWYSLGLFLPFVNLQTAESWQPKRKHTLLRNYVRVHILLGWILIPILLAAISGLIK